VQEAQLPFWMSSIELAEEHHWHRFNGQRQPGHLPLYDRDYWSCRKNPLSDFCQIAQF
jgi:hypothetical protein